MTDGIPGSPADQPFFRALLRPHRSLDRTGFLLLMAALALAWLVVGAIFMAHGAWPVIGFCGLDLLAVYLAFRYNYRAARIREEISLSRTCLEIRRIEPSGQSCLHRFNPFWSRFSVARRKEIGITHMAITSHGHSVSIGSFLNPYDRESFAAEFSRALATARRG